MAGGASYICGLLSLQPMNELAFFFSAVFAQAGGQAQSPLSMIILWGGVFIIFYVFFILPQMRRQKKDKEFRKGLDKGQRVVTLSGIHGKVVSVEEHTVLLEVDEGVKLRMNKDAVARPLDQKPAETKK